MTKEKYPYKECDGCSWKPVFKDEDPDMGVGIPLSKAPCGALKIDCPHEPFWPSKDDTLILIPGGISPMTKEAEKVDIGKLKKDLLVIHGFVLGKLNPPQDNKIADGINTAFNNCDKLIDELKASREREQKWLDEIIGLKDELKALQERFYADGEIIRGLRMDKVELEQENERLREALKMARKQIDGSKSQRIYYLDALSIIDNALGGKDE